MLKSSTKSILYFIHPFNETFLDRDKDGVERNRCRKDDPNVEDLRQMAAMPVVVLSSKGTQECL